MNIEEMQQMHILSEGLCENNLEWQRNITDQNREGSIWTFCGSEKSKLKT